MATTLRMKRMIRERQTLEKPSDDYMVLFKDDDCLKFDAYVIGPSETLYSHKFIKLRFDIVNNYPLNPPRCKFIQHSGGRVHPNLYTEGKVCLSILGTWDGEPWTFAMTCETVLITIRSLLDNKPYTHEPNQADDACYNNYVQYSTWKSLLLDYLRNETEPELKAFLQKYVAENSEAIFNELECQATANEGVTRFSSPYGEDIIVNYASLIKDVKNVVEECKRIVSNNVATAVKPVNEDVAKVDVEATQASTSVAAEAGPTMETATEKRSASKNCTVI